VTVSPTWIVIVAGVKWKSAIVTAGSRAPCSTRALAITARGRLTSDLDRR
jgi:hypothetical protein